MGFICLPSLTFLYSWYRLSGYFFFYHTEATKQHVLIAMTMLESNKTLEMKMAMAMQIFLGWLLQSFSTVLQLDITTTHESAKWLA